MSGLKAATGHALGSAQRTRFVGGDDTMDLGRPDGNTFNIDVGSAAKYEAGHVAGARSIPIDVLPPRLSESPDGTDVVAY